MNPDTISHYRILKKIGSGGMGDVYLAEDTRLNRKVALKLLPREFSKDQERIRRFEREARAVSTLNHPYILTIYDIGQVDSSTFIASEFIDGETLRNRMRVAKIPLKEILSIVSQVAEALDAAHRAGIIHRDIKPENIMLRQDGYAKVLDFGLAKLTENKSTSGGSDLETMSSTQPGIVLGTVRYMSPEQARGSRVDARADIFSLGVVLYELITGRVPFDGATPQEMLVAILEKHPSALRTYGDFPEELQWIVTKALAKDPEERYQTSKDLLTDLKRVRKQLEIEEELRRSDRSGLAKAEIESKFRAPRRPFKFFAAAAVLLILIIAAVQFLSKRPSGQVKNISLNPSQRQVTFNGMTLWSAISPDGKFVAYYELPDQVLVQSLAGGNPSRVSYPGTNVREIRWSPDSTQLLLATASKKGELQGFTVNPFGGQPRPVSMIGMITCWSPDVTRIASTNDAAKNISITSIKEPGRSHNIKINLPFEFVFIHDLDWSAAGRFAMLVSTKTQSLIVTMGVDGSQPEIVIKETLDAITNPRWAWDSNAIYFWKNGKNQQSELMKIEISSETGKAIGNPKLILSHPGRMLSLSFSRNGVLAYNIDGRKSNIWSFTLNDSKKEWKRNRLTQGTWEASIPSISPDGTTVAFSLTRDNTSIFIVPVAGGDLRQLTFEDEDCARPVWSPSGKSLAAVCEQDGARKIVLISVDGSPLYEFDKPKVSNSWFLSWAPGNSILYQLPDNRNFHFLDPNTGKETPLLTDTSRGWMFDPLVSPDQKNATFRVNWGLKQLWGIWLENLSNHTGRLLVPGSFNKPIGWSSDSKWIYFKPSSGPVDIAKVSVDTKKVIELPSIHFEGNEGIEWISMGPDERIFAAEVSEWDSDVWITENFDPEALSQN